MPPRLCPARNRIIAALGAVTVVVEAAERSGSLITAEVAADLGRDIGAVPGPVMSWRAKGTNALLRDGAMLIRDARDVLDGVVGVESSAVPDPAAGLEPRLASLLRAVAGGRDTPAALAGAPDQAQSTLAALTELELAGRLRRVAGGRYVVVAPWGARRQSYPGCRARPAPPYPRVPVDRRFGLRRRRRDPGGPQ